MTSTSETGSCTVCNKPNTRYCKKCQRCRYCSKECQVEDWKVHRLLCANFASFDTSSRPSQDHRRAIFLPADSEYPQVVWLDCPWSGSEFFDTNRYQRAIVEPFLGRHCPEDVSVTYNQTLKRRLSDAIQLCCRDNFFKDGSLRNKCISLIRAGASGQDYDWRGPVLVYGKVGLDINARACRDVDMNDFRHITDFLRTYYETPKMSHYSSGPRQQSSTTPQQPAKGTSPQKPIEMRLHPVRIDQPAKDTAPQKSTEIKVKGVRINCRGDQHTFGKKHFEAIELSSNDSIFSSHYTSDIADRIGIPIFTRRCPPDPVWADSPDHPFNNADVTFLHKCCDPTAKFDPGTGRFGWGMAHDEWQNSVGSAIIVRQDKKPLLPLHAEALCNYCRHQIGPLFEHSRGSYAPDEPLSPDAVLAMMCRPTFSIYWYKFMEEKMKADDYDGSDAPFPFNT